MPASPFLVAGHSSHWAAIPELDGRYLRVVMACLGNPDPVDMKVYCPTGKETFNDEKTEEALLLLLMLKKPLVRSLDGLG